MTPRRKESHKPGLRVRCALSVAVGVLSIATSSYGQTEEPSGLKPTIERTEPTSSDVNTKFELTVVGTNFTPKATLLWRSPGDDTQVEC